MRVRVVILNYNGGELTMHAVESVLRSESAGAEVEVVVVDNASTDGSVELVRRNYPDVRLVESGENLGFPGGNNLALADLGDADYVALLNNDAAVEPGWLGPLLAALENDPGLGAASPKILFAPSFRRLALEAETFVPGRADPRELGVRLSGVRSGGTDRWGDTQLGEGFYGLERGHGEESTFCWSHGTASLSIPAPTDVVGVAAAIRVAAEREKELVLRSGDRESRALVGTEPAWIDVELSGPALNVVNNAGSIMVDGGYGGDRGFREVDRGQYDKPCEVFAWCGCSVLLRRRYLEEVGIFDPRLFLYYEDFDLSWRGRAQGWGYRYEPESVVRHVHTATSIEDSPLFVYYVERNRLLVHAKNAPASYAWRAFAGSARPTARFVVRDVLSPVLHRRRPHPGLVRLRVRALAGFARLLPGALADRRDLRRRQRVPDAELLAWRTRQ